MSRKEFSARVKAAALKRCMDANGVPRCEGECFDAKRCDLTLRAGDTFYDHDQADGLGGEPTIENCKVLCGICHRYKTIYQDNPRMVKADAQRKKHYGVTRKRRTIPGRKFSGEPIPARWR